MNKKIDQATEINKYFREFIIEYRNSFFSDDISKKIIKEIVSNSNVEFDSNWNYLMVLTEIIETVFEIESICIEKNYCRFDFSDDRRVQDKAPNKLGAIFSCCFQTLEENWTSRKAPKFSRGVEPFDLDEL